MYTREREESTCYHTIQNSHQYGPNMAAFGHISDTEVTFLEISAVIVIHVIIAKNILCELIITFFIGTQITFHIYHAQSLLLISTPEPKRNIHRLIP